MNLAFDFTVPPVDPRESPCVPHQSGSHSSWTGARSQTVAIWTAKQSALLQVLANGNPMTRNELAVVLHWPLSSVCSILDSVRDRVEVADFETVEWGDGRRSTKRERFKVKR